MALFGIGTKKEEKKKRAPRRTAPSHAKAQALPEGKAHDILLAPWLSEKALIATERGVYAFAVPKSATKAEIAGAVKEIYKVSPRRVRIVNLPGKHKALRTRRGEGVQGARRKAYVYLAAGDSIQFA